MSFDSSCNAGLFCIVGGFDLLDIYIYDGKQEATQPSEEIHDLSTQQGTGSILVNFESLLFVDSCDRF
jgi:hypothetical protein